MNLLSFFIDKAHKPIYNQGLIIAIMQTLMSKGMLTGGECQKIIADAVAMTKDLYEEEENTPKNPRPVKE